MSAGKLVLLIGPSGVGKSEIMKHFKVNHPELHFPRSATTRARREGEGDDIYHFVSDTEFDALLDEGKILEYAVIHGKQRSATLADEIIPFIEAGKTVLREVDVQGFDSIWSHKLFRGPNAPFTLQSIFILPESKAQLIKHITERAPMSEEELQRRMASMEYELDYADSCDVQIVNKEGELAGTIELVKAEIFS